MTVIRYPFIRTTSILIPALLLALSGGGVHAAISSHWVKIVSAPPITAVNEPAYVVYGDCGHVDGDNAEVTVTISDSESAGVSIVTQPCESGTWSVTHNVTDFGSGLVADGDGELKGVLKRDVMILASLTAYNSVVGEHAVWVHRNPDFSRSAPDLMIGLTENRTVIDQEFQASASCGANKITIDDLGVMTLHDTECARMVSTTNQNATLEMDDQSTTGALGACEFEKLTMNGAGDIHITVDPQASEPCLDDKDTDGLLDIQDPEPGESINNARCLDSQELIDNIALKEAVVPSCEAIDSLTIQGVRLPAADENNPVCYKAGQFVRFAAPALASAGPVFSVPNGTKFSIAVNGSECGS